MAYKRRPARKPRRKATKPRRMRKPALKSSLGTFKKMLAKVSEKKRYYIAPVALTNGDITCVAPFSPSRNGGLVGGFIQPVPLAQQYCTGADYNTKTVGGWMSMDITPYPTENNGFNGREGSSINLNSSYMQFKFTQMSVNTLTPIKIRMVIVEVRGQPQDSSAALTQYFLNSALPNGTGINNNNGIIDYNSNVSPDQFHQYRTIYNKTTTLWQDNIDAGLQVRNHVIKLKYNRGKGHMVRFLQNSLTPTGGQLLMFILADAGNLGINAYEGTGAATLVNNSANSGALVNFNICHYYTDP